MDTVQTILAFGFITFYPPTVLLSIAGLLYAPAFVVILAISFLISFSKRFSAYSLPLLAVYFAFPVSLAVAFIATLPVLIFSGGAVFLSKPYVSQEFAPVVAYSAMLITSITFFVASFLIARKLCAQAWRWCLVRRLNG